MADARELPGGANRWPVVESGPVSALVSTPLLDVPERHREHDRKGQPCPRLHLVHAADEVVLKAEAVVDTVVDSFQCGAPVVAPMPARAAMGRRHEATAICSEILMRTIRP